MKNKHNAREREKERDVCTSESSEGTLNVGRANVVFCGGGNSVRDIYSWRVYKLRCSEQNSRKTTVAAFEHVGKFVANIETMGYDPSWAAF